MSAIITLTIGQRKLELTAEEARQVLDQLSAIIAPVKSQPQTFLESMQFQQELELERLRKENRQHRREERPRWQCGIGSHMQ